MRNLRFILPISALLALSACGGAKEQLGLTRQAPDEFAVVKRAPLSLPPNYALRPPEPGAARPQEQNTASQARQAIFGVEEQAEPRALTRSGSLGEAAFLQQAGGSEAQDDIRSVVDSETTEYDDSSKPVADKLLGIVRGNNATPASVVDAQKEADRLRENLKKGKPVTDGETPSIEQ